MTADVDVILGEYKTAEAVVEGGESVEQLELLFLRLRRRILPDADFAVLVRGEDFAAQKSDSLNGAGGGILSVECGDVGKGGSVVDVDFVGRGRVEVGPVYGEMGDRERRGGL